MSTEERTPAVGDRQRHGGARDRRRGREAALQMLYQWDVGSTDIEDVVLRFWAFERPDEPEAGQRVRDFAAQLATGVTGGLDRIDPLIEESAEHWRPSRMAVLDRLILRLAVYELLLGDTPANVVINEALELARTFSTDEAVKFVNGVLDGIRHKLEQQKSEM